MSEEEITIKIGGDTEEAKAALDDFADNFEDVFDALINGSIKNLSVAIGELPGLAWQRAGENLRTTMKDIAGDAERSASRTTTAMNSLVNASAPNGKADGNEQPKTDTSLNIGNNENQSDTTNLRDELNQQLVDQKLYGEQAKAFEAKFWQDKLDQAQQGSATYLAILQKVYSADSEQAAKTNQENIKIADEGIKERANLALEQVNTDDKIAEIELKNHEITAQQKLQLDQQYENRRYAIESEALQQLLALENTNLAKKAQTEDQLELLAKKHADKQLEITKEMAAQEVGVFGSLGNTISSTLSHAFTQMAQGTTSFVNILKGIWNTLVATFIQSVTKMVVAHALGENSKTLATSAGEEERLALKLWGSIQSLAISAAEGIKQIAISAYTAMAGAYAAIAAIPYVGPFLAPAAAATAGAAVFEIGSSIASASGGWMVPQDTLAMVHKDERILPARYSAGLDAMVGDAANSSATASGTRGGNHYHFHDHSGRATPQSISDNQAAFATMARKAARSFSLKKK